MSIEFDIEKDIANRKKHGLSVADAAKLDLDSAAVIPDERYS